MSKRAKIAAFFLEEEHPFTKKRKFKTKTVKLVAISTGLLSIFLVLFAGNTVEKKEAALQRKSDTESRELPKPTPLDRTKFYEESVAGKVQPMARQFSASQIVKRENRAHGNDGLPMGSTIPVKLMNTVLSSDADSPVIAELLDDVLWQNSVLIPQGTKAIGHGNLDEMTERLRTRFHTFVFPDGSQHPLSGLALLPDGSSGIPGHFHSRAFKKHSGKFIGDFVAGTAQGLKEKRSEGQAALTHEPGTLKNGLLNGLAAGALDFAQSSSDDMKNVRPYLEVPSGTSFVIYLEREFSP